MPIYCLKHLFLLYPFISKIQKLEILQPHELYFFLHFEYKKEIADLLSLFYEILFQFLPTARFVASIFLSAHSTTSLILSVFVKYFIFLSFRSHCFAQSSICSSMLFAILFALPFQHIHYQKKIYRQVYFQVL